MILISLDSPPQKITASQLEAPTQSIILNSSEVSSSKVINCPVQRLFLKRMRICPFCSGKEAQLPLNNYMSLSSHQFIYPQFLSSSSSSASYQPTTLTSPMNTSLQCNIESLLKMCSNHSLTYSPLKLRFFLRPEIL